MSFDVYWSKDGGMYTEEIEDSDPIKFTFIEFENGTLSSIVGFLKARVEKRKSVKREHLMAILSSPQPCRGLEA